MPKIKYCDLCFSEADDCTCKPVHETKPRETFERDKSKDKFQPRVGNEVWINVPSPFKPYPPSEGV